MELLGLSTQKWLTAGGLGTVLLSLAGREVQLGSLILSTRTIKSSYSFHFFMDNPLYSISLDSLRATLQGIVVPFSLHFL